MNYTREQLFSYMKKCNYLVFEKGDFNVNIIAVRSDIIDRTEDTFNDVIKLYYKEKNNWVENSFTCTTTPGLVALKNPSFPEAQKNGTAIIVPGQYSNAYKLGWHYNIPALVQVGNIKIFRDKNKNNILDFNYNSITEGSHYGINIHGTNERYKGDKVLNFSEGCCVVKNWDEYLNFISIIKNAVYYQGNSFTLTLIDSDELNQFLLNHEIII